MPPVTSNLSATKWPEGTSLRLNDARVEAAYGDWGERYVREGWSPYMMTFMFQHMTGSEATVTACMNKEVERVYATHVTRVVRKPTAPSAVGRLPVWVCSPDRPVFKHEKQGRWDVLVNDGLHMHATAFYPPSSRLREDLTNHFEDLRDLYVRPKFPLIRIDVKPITDRLAYVIEYVRKHIARGLAGQDASLILPKSHSEVRSL